MDSTDQNFSKLGSSDVTVDDSCSKMEAADCDKEHGNRPDNR